MCDLSITEVLHHYLYFAFLLPGLPVALATFEDVTDTLRVTTVDCTLARFPQCLMMTALRTRSFSWSHCS